MKGKIISKIVIVLIIGVIFLAMPVNIFATSNGAIDLNTLETWEEQEDPTLTDPEPTPTPTPTDPEPTPIEPTTPTITPTTPEKEELPKAGLVEDTAMIISILVLGITAVITFKKFNEYNNI